jgi:hypothetical protein
METKINESNFETIDNIMRRIRRKKKEIKDLEDAMSKHKSKDTLNTVEISFCKGKSYETNVSILADSMSNFITALSPVLIGVLQTEIDSLYKEIESL